MITRIEAYRYRCFSKLAVDFQRFNVLAGPNGSGKTTMVDIPVMLGDCIDERVYREAFLKNRNSRGCARAHALTELTVHSRVVEFLRYPGGQPLRDWLRDLGHWPDGEPKPTDPKNAVEVTLGLTRTRRSGAIYGRIVERISPRSCSDPAFVKLRDALRRWFPLGGEA
ncbi:MAG TPA: hypothetical protein VFU48_01450 [Nitrospira sp.]|nr:hypothetical protein [Nitrospira sp.]